MPFLLWQPTDFHLQEINDEIAVLKILHKDWSDSRIYLKASWNVYKGLIYTSLDIIGFVPVLGELADGVNVVFYLGEGDTENASYSAISLVPIIGDGADKGTKYTRKVLNWVKVGSRSFESSSVRKAAYEILFKKYGERIADAIWDARNSKLIRDAIENAGLALKKSWQAHHLIPKKLIETFTVLQNAIKDGFEFNKLQNLMPLDGLRHLGKHDDYTRGVSALIDLISEKFPKLTDKQKIEKAVDYAAPHFPYSK